MAVSWLGYKTWDHILKLKPFWLGFNVLLIRKFVFFVQYDCNDLVAVDVKPT